MEALSYFFIVLPFVAALLIGLAVPFGLMVAYRITIAWGDTSRLIIILWLIVIGATLSVVLTTRNINYTTEYTPLLTASDFSSGFMASRLVTLALLVWSIVTLLRGWLANRDVLVNPASGVLGAFLVYSFGTIFIQVFGSAYPSFNYKTLYAPIVMIAIYYLVHTDMNVLVRHFKWLLLVPVSGSLIAAMIAPDFALNRPYSGLLPGIDFRLYGVTEHANVLGPLALLLILVELHFPSRRRWRGVILAIAITTFVLAQSKTAWLMTLGLLVLVFIPYRLAVYRTQSRQTQGTLLFLLGIVVILMVVTLGLSFVDGSRFIDKYGLTTFTGRTVIWEKTIDEWQRNPLFGYGSEIWGVEYRIRAGMLHVGHAHNQFIQTLGEAGIMGLLLLVSYLAVLLRYAIKYFMVSRGFILALLVISLFHCFSEAPFRISAFMEWGFFTHALLFLSVVHYAHVQSQSIVQVGVVLDPVDEIPVFPKVRDKNMRFTLGSNQG